MDSLGLQVLAEACKTCNESFNTSDDDDKENVDNDMKSDSNFHLTLYCKARGTPLDHQQEKAMLKFSSGEEYTHGAELICSHLVCRQGGVKFRYCAYCRKAVAKRNFRKRHSHTDELVLPCQNINNNAMHYQETYKQQCNPSNTQLYLPMQALHPGHPQQRQPLMPLQAKQLLQTWNMGNDNLSEEDDSDKRKTKRFEFNESNNMNLDDSSSKTSIDNGVPKEWIDLYKKKPYKNSTAKDTDDWITEVKKIANIESNQMINQNDCSNIKMTYDDDADNSTNISHGKSFSFEEMSSNSIQYYDKIVTEVREEFKGIVPPRSNENFSTIDSGNYQKNNAFSLQINTDADTIGSNSTIVFDSKGSVILTPKYFSY